MEAQNVVSGSSPDGLFLDVGANFGSCAFLMGHLGFDVLAMEPDPAVASLLRAGVVQNRLEDKISVLETAVGRDSNTFATLHATAGHSATGHVIPWSEQVFCLLFLLMTSSLCGNRLHSPQYVAQVHASHVWTTPSVL